MLVYRVLLLLPVLLASAQGPSDGCTLNTTVVATDTSTAITHVGYSTSIVETEYIVTFNSYYTTEARDGFVSAALRPFHGWTLLPRTNPSQQFPSDFSVVQLRGSAVADSLLALRQHPTVKRVTPQKKLTRMLTFSGQGQ